MKKEPREMREKERFFITKRFSRQLIENYQKQEQREKLVTFLYNFKSSEPDLATPQND